jgi:tripartite-type tricarboxylate transporter receptor subunit TctC
MKKVFSLTLGLFIAANASSAKAADPYFAGKTMTVIVGYGAGGGYTAYARVLSKYLVRHIPGNPTVIVRQMPGGGSLIAANYIYNVSKPDGLTIGMVNMFNMYGNYMAKTDAVRYDITNMNFIGNLRSGNPVFMMRSDTYPSLEALKAANRPIHLGYAVKGDGHHVFGAAMGIGLGINIHHSFGYTGGGEIDLALDRKEIDGRVANLNSHLIAKPDWIKSGFVKVLSQQGVIDRNGNVVRDPRIADVPTIRELFPDNNMVQHLVDFSSIGDLLSGIYVAPPKTPDDLLTILRAGFMATINDPNFLAEAEKFSLDITPMDAAEIQSIVDRALQVSPDVVKLVADLTR